jgi:uncharacterized membrane protein YhaH (DUF805 family)
VDWGWFLFGFGGRINRAKYWLAILIVVCWMMFLGLLTLAVAKVVGSPPKSLHLGINDIFSVVDPASFRAAVAAFHQGNLASAGHLIPMVLYAIGTPLFLWVYLAISIKRLHDRDRSGWWMLPFFVVPGLYSQFVDRLPDSYVVFPLAVAVFVLGIWGFVEMYCLTGTRWTNRFGTNPLPKVQTRPRSASSWRQHREVEFIPRTAGPLAATHVKRGHD